MDLNVFMNDVHENAVAHGWWDDDRSDATIRSLFHCEVSEAVEAYRSGEPDHWHKCPNGLGRACEKTPVHEDDLHCEACTPSMRKPEGVCVEYIDFVIRVLDYLGQKGEHFPEMISTVKKLADWSVDDFMADDIADVLELNPADFADVIHTEIALSDVMHNLSYLWTACGLVLAWVEHRNHDAAAMLAEKHEYNKTRSYKHGGKVC